MKGSNGNDQYKSNMRHPVRIDLPVAIQSNFDSYSHEQYVGGQSQQDYALPLQSPPYLSPGAYNHNYPLYYSQQLPPNNSVYMDPRYTMTGATGTPNIYNSNSHIVRQQYHNLYSSQPCHHKSFSNSLDYSLADESYNYDNFNESSFTSQSKEMNLSPITRRYDHSYYSTIPDPHCFTFDGVSPGRDYPYEYTNEPNSGMNPISDLPSFVSSISSKSLNSTQMTSTSNNLIPSNGLPKPDSQLIPENVPLINPVGIAEHENIFNTTKSTQTKSNASGQNEDSNTSDSITSYINIISDKYKNFEGSSIPDDFLASATSVSHIQDSSILTTSNMIDNENDISKDISINKTNVKNTKDSHDSLPYSATHDDNEDSILILNPILQSTNSSESTKNTCIHNQNLIYNGINTNQTVILENKVKNEDLKYSKPIDSHSVSISVDNLTNTPLVFSPILKQTNPIPVSSSSNLKSSSTVLHESNTSTRVSQQSQKSSSKSNSPIKSQHISSTSTTSKTTTNTLSTPSPKKPSVVVIPPLSSNHSQTSRSNKPLSSPPRILREAISTSHTSSNSSSNNAPSISTVFTSENTTPLVTPSNSMNSAHPNHYVGSDAPPRDLKTQRPNPLHPLMNPSSMPSMPIHPNMMSSSSSSSSSISSSLDLFTETREEQKTDLSYTPNNTISSKSVDLNEPTLTERFSVDEKLLQENTIDIGSNGVTIISAAHDSKEDMYSHDRKSVSSPGVLHTKLSKTHGTTINTSGLSTITSNTPLSTPKNNQFSISNEHNEIDNKHNNTSLESPRKNKNEKNGERKSYVCRDFIYGVCQRGVNCRFSHNLNDFYPPEIADLPREIPVCKNYLNGKCTRSNCRFRHPCPNDADYDTVMKNHTTNTTCLLNILESKNNGESFKSPNRRRKLKPSTNIATYEKK